MRAAWADRASAKALFSYALGCPAMVSKGSSRTRALKISFTVRCDEKCKGEAELISVEIGENTQAKMNIVKD